MDRAVAWYRDIFCFEVIYGPYACHTEFALPVRAHVGSEPGRPDTQIRKGPGCHLTTGRSGR